MSRQPIYNIYWKLVYKSEIRYGRSCWWCQSISKNSTLSYLQLYFICCHFNHNISLDERNWNFGLLGARWPQTWMLGYLIASSYTHFVEVWDLLYKELGSFEIIYINKRLLAAYSIRRNVVYYMTKKKSISHGLVTLNSGVK